MTKPRRRTCPPRRRGPLKRRTWSATRTCLVSALAITALMAAPPMLGASADEPSAAIGKRIYREGILPSGDPLQARVQTDVNVQGPQLVCQNCHGRSGLGQGEGAIFMPAIAASTLYEPREIRNKDFHVSRTVRPAYTDATLARAIRSGLDPNGRVLDAMMPRYSLDDDELSALGAYLKTLSSSLSPGVTATHIHFATVISEDVVPEKRDAMLDVLEKFFEKKNAGTRLETRRAVNAPGYKQWHYEAYRKWVLHTWELRGPPSTWPDQLESLYKRQPVFAMMSGFTTGSWAPVHAFCEARGIPCLFPNTDLPVISDDDYYTMYFSKGMTLEAEVLAKHLHREAPTVPIVQIYRDEPRGTTAAASLRQALGRYGIADLRDRRITGQETVRASFWQDLDRENPSAWLVIWLSADDLSNITALSGHTAERRRIYVSSALLGDRLQSIPDGLAETLYAVHRFDLPEDAARRRRRSAVWLRSNGVEAGDTHLQMNALFTTTVVAQALKHVGSNFYRDYFIERVEHILDSMVMPSAYPALTLAPNQRFASKGGYIVGFSRGAGDESRPTHEWIVP